MKNHSFWKRSFCAVAIVGAIGLLSCQNTFTQVVKPQQRSQNVHVNTTANTLQTTSNTLKNTTKLIVVMSFDQMRGDYPQRWGRLWGQKGFNRILKQGAYYPNCYFNHASNITAPGHSVHLTGVYPHKSGIVSNDFFDREAHRRLYCVQDTINKTFGMTKPEDWCSPANLKAPTLGDYIKTLSPKSKVVGISQKDRAAILMSGHKADAAYWFEFEAGGYTTSEYYAKSLPEWVRRWNEANSFRKYEGKIWNTVITDSAAMIPDSLRWEGNFGRLKNTFPYTLPVMSSTNANNETNSSIFTLSPFAIDHLFKFVRAAFKEEKLATDDIPDVLCVSISSTDYVGHSYGPDSREVQELYVHVDRMVGEFLEFLDTTVGNKNYTVVITSDHGVAPVPEYLKYVDKSADAGRIRYLEVVESMDEYLRSTFPAGAGAKWIQNFEPPSIFLSQETLTMVTTASIPVNSTAPKITRELIIDSLRAHLLRYPGVGIAVTEQDIRTNICPNYLSPWVFALVKNDYYPPRTGEIMFYPQKNWILGSITATHGTPHDYDRHSPLMFMGAGIKAGYYKDKVAPSDIAPTLAKLLGITMENLDGKSLPVVPD